MTKFSTPPEGELILESPIYLLLAALTPLRHWLQAGKVTPTLLKRVSENQWLNLLESTVLAQIEAGDLQPEQALHVPPKWELDEVHYNALRVPGVRALIEKQIFSFDRFASLNKVQCTALLKSEGLRKQLLSGVITAPYFLRHSPIQLQGLVEELQTPTRIL